MKTKCVSCGERFFVEEPADDIQAKRAALAEGGAHTTKSGSVAGGVAIGVVMMIVAVAWFVGGLAVNHIYIYPPIMFVLGLIQVIRSLVGRPN
ncbi:MAG TPA: hypothetical protein VHR66_25925 [Gemmataceae bacterium]|jgi:hypothetical protein|nr:hypothetical protein [Gemmataceae bacterium]